MADVGGARGEGRGRRADDEPIGVDFYIFALAFCGAFYAKYFTTRVARREYAYCTPTSSTNI
jgi:hypothetical protein